ncbi:hypothetical protein [Tenacibaculum maritimum]|uniref:hypothetical protein n=1 Tax=Tenacibaculum maritimum TaxID=107401 RepID=UPI0012E4579B|nr:hypothetical protein [Tenacibaculum maritimum]CAA0248323.1 conserved hypothetical protein [Tenacibaculum maritimum]
MEELILGCIFADMAADKELTQKKYLDIRKDFEKWKNKKYKNVCIYAESYIYMKLSEKFYLSTRTIENIVYYRTKLKSETPIQASLFPKAG